MRIKGDENAAAIAVGGPGTNLPEHFPVPQVHAVEGAHSDDYRRSSRRRPEVPVVNDSRARRVVTHEEHLGGLRMPVLHRPTATNSPPEDTPPGWHHGALPYLPTAAAFPLVRIDCTRSS